MESVTVCCRLPNGIVLEHPSEPDKKIHLAGRNKASIIGQDYGVTELDVSVWEALSNNYKNSLMMKSGTIYAAKNIKTLERMSDEFKDSKTGFEPMPQNTAGISTMVA
jgi:hypothetical protein